MTRHSRSRLSGAASVELAILFPLLIAIVFGVLEFGFVLYNKVVITNAAREGARKGTVLRAGNAPNANGIARMPLTGTDSVKSVAESYCSGKLFTMSANSGCVANVSNPDGGQKASDRLEVSVSYTYTSTSLLAVFGLMQDGSLPLRSTARMRYE